MTADQVREYLANIGARGGRKSKAARCKCGAVLRKDGKCTRCENRERKNVAASLLASGSMTRFGMMTCSLARLFGMSR